MTTWYFTRIGANETFTQTAADLAGFAYEDDVTLPDGTTTDRFQAVPVADQQHTSGLYLARATDSFDPSAQAIGASITFAATPLRPYFVGAFVRAEDAADSTTFIEGEITAYDPDTGDLTIQVVRTAGSGTVSDWLIKSAGRAGAFAFSGLTFEYNFDTSTSDADPGAGNLRADNSDLTAATELYVDDETADGANVKAALQTIADSTNPTLGQLLIATKFDPTKFVLYDVTGFTDASGYRKVNVTHVDGSGASPFPNSAAVIFGFARSGNEGAVGSTGLRYKFDDSTSDADPGDGNLRADASDLTTATTLYIDDKEQGGTSVTSFLKTFDDAAHTPSGILYITDRNDTTNFAVFHVNGGVTDASGYVKVPVSHQAGASSPFSNGADLDVVFAQAADDGKDGAGAGGTTRTISSDLALTASDVFAQHIKADVDKVRVSLADATNLDKGLAFGLYNRGLTGNDLVITDVDGNPLITQLGPNAGLTWMLHDNATSDGTWGITYDNGSGITLTGVSAQVTELVVASDEVTGTMLDTSVGISIYTDSNRSDKLFSRVVDFSQNPVALLGSELEVDTVKVNGLGVRYGIRHVDTQDALVAYGDSTNDNVLAVLLRWDGSSLTIADGPFTVEDFGLSFYPVIDRLSSTEFVVCYDDFDNSNLKAALLDVSSSTISKSDSITISTENSKDGSVVEFDSTFSVLVWVNSTNSRVDVALLKWDGTNLTNPNSITGLNVNGTNFSNLNVSKVNSTQVVVVLDEGSNDNIELHLLDVDTNNDTISSTDSLVLTNIGASNSQAGRPQILSERTNVVELAAEDGNANRVVLEFSISSNTITKKQTLLDDREASRFHPLISVANPPSIYDVPVVGQDNENSNNISATKVGLSKLQVTP